jgi:hypothetical protein
MKFPTFTSKSFLILLLVTVTFFVSCNDTTKKTENVVETTQEATLEQKKQALESVAPTQTSTNGDVALNPAHGMPGHNCAIPVGAPLNGGSATPKAAEAQTINVNSNNATPVKSSGTGAINPAHGQPGHDCAVPVGAPL